MPTVPPAPNTSPIFMPPLFPPPAISTLRRRGMCHRLRTPAQPAPTDGGTSMAISAEDARHGRASGARLARRRTSGSPAKSLLVFGGELLGHAPAEGDEAVVALAVEAVEVGGDLGGDGVGLGGLEVEDAARGAVAGDH